MNNRFQFLALFFVLALSPLATLAEPAPPTFSLTGHKSTVIGLAFSPDGKHLASVADDGHLKVWDLAAKKELFDAEGTRNNRNQIRYTPDGSTIVVLGSSNTVLVLDAKSGKPKSTIAMENLPGGPMALDLSPDGKTVAVVGRSALRLIDVASGKVTSDYEVHKLYAVNSVAFSPDGKRVATTGTDHVAMILEPAGGKVIAAYKLSLNGEIVAFTHDGKNLIVSSSDQLVQMFDIAAGQVQKLLDEHIPVLSISVSTDGKTVVFGGTGRGPWLLSLPDGKVTNDAYQSDDRLMSAAISPDGKLLAGGANEGAVHIWQNGK